MSSLPAAVQAEDTATSRLRTHILRSGPRDAPAPDDPFNASSAPQE